MFLIHLKNLIEEESRYWDDRAFKKIPEKKKKELEENKEKEAPKEEKQEKKESEDLLILTDDLI